MIKKLIKLSIASVMMFSAVSVSHAAEKKTTPIILKMNDYFVAYTYPKEPYIDKQNRLILPLRSVSELLGASVSYDNLTKTAVVKEGEQVVEIQAGSKIAKVNGQNVEMDTKAVVEKGYLLVPARILFDSFSFKVISKNNVITLNDERLLKKGRLKYLSDDDRIGVSRTINPNAFKPLDITYRVFVKDKVSMIDLTVTAKNITGQDIAKGQEDLHTIVYFEHSSIMSDADDSTIDIKERPRLAVKKDAVIQTQINAAGGTIIQPNELQYIFIAGRTLEPLDYSK